MSSLNYPSVVERYYRKFYWKSSLIKPFVADEDICILSHSNRICLVTLAPKHKALQEGKIQSVSYDVNGRDYNLDNKVHGKKKRDAFKVSPTTPVCLVTTGQGNVYKIRSGIFGKFTEANENLVSNPSLLNEMPGTNGYIAVLLHKFCPNDELCGNLLTEAQYADGYLQNFICENSEGEEEKLSANPDIQNDPT